MTGAPFDALKLTEETVTALKDAGVTSITVASGSEGLQMALNGNNLPYLDWSGGKLGPAIELLAASGQLDSLAEQMEGMRVIQAQAEEGRAQLDAALEGLTAAVTRLSGRSGDDSETRPALDRVAAGQERLIALLQSQHDSESEPHIEAETRLRLRSMDVQLVRILEELSAGRQEAMADLRSDISMLTQAVRMLNRQPPPGVGREDDY